VKNEERMRREKKTQGLDKEPGKHFLRIWRMAPDVLGCTRMLPKIEITFFQI
jgi:hypothetical protein